MWWLRIRIRVARRASVLAIFRRDTDGFVRARLNHGGCYWRVTKEKNAGAWDLGRRTELEFRDPERLCQNQEQKPSAAEAVWPGKPVRHD